MIDYEGTVTARVAVKLTANDWQLFTASMNCTRAAAALNRAASKALSTGDVKEAWAIFQEAQNEWAAYGAADTEPRWVFADLVDRFIGVEAND